MANSKRGQKYMMKNGLYSSCNARPQSSATHICLPVHLKANPFRKLAAFIWLAAFILTFSQCGVDAIRLQVHKVDDKSTGAEKRGGGASLMGGSFLQREQTYTPPQDNTVLLWDPIDDYRFKSRDKFYPQDDQSILSEQPQMQLRSDLVNDRAYMSSRDLLLIGKNILDKYESRAHARNLLDKRSSRGYNSNPWYKY
ncbi:uncharacterized protein LOC134848531 [Symsagittifera roscoffensis]|uniref:uncharacterized protein LOC134848531 n=1 Tax=Symsagittifera roscoffensis TaxID=84072 RepID=UPI00307CAFC1